MNPLDGWTVDPDAITLTGRDLRRPECVLAEPSGDLWVADLRGGVVHIAPDGSQDVVEPVGGGGPFAPANPVIDGNQGFSLPNGLCFDPDGDFVVADFGTNVIAHLTRGGRWRLIADSVVWPDGSIRRIGKANFPAIDGEGRLWFSVTASARAWRDRDRAVEDDGYLAVLDDWRPGTPRPARVVATDLGGTNELRFADDGRRLYVAETGADRLTRFEVGPDATLHGREVHGPPQLGGNPDGIAFDAHGNLWATLIGTDRLVAVTPEGRVHTLWEGGDLAPRMASVTFGGPDLRTVYIGSLMGSALPTFRSPLPGAPLRPGPGR